MVYYLARKSEILVKISMIEYFMSPSEYGQISKNCFVIKDRILG